MRRVGHCAELELERLDAGLLEELTARARRPFLPVLEVPAWQPVPPRCSARVRAFRAANAAAKPAMQKNAPRVCGRAHQGGDAHADLRGRGHNRCGALCEHCLR
eukprot:CAMPEP_0180042244 /NCGR_PEP_ID=MMETSP0984-20121128/34626_1 /TAXON_ID=483367 /ORGANISM="non described non described, Strain CCMP 2436" /LENGTH=103 /DNA_ID=CAMNT_0021970011 /DNA_START=238 /DNA_END=547 /DNA_ORIENTATION=+